MILNEKEILVENVSIICDEFSFSNAVNKINLKGNNKIRCKKATLEKNDANGIEINSDEGTLNIEYSDIFTDNNRKFLIKKANGMKLIFKKF